jgi:hypothetical protein
MYSRLLESVVTFPHFDDVERESVRTDGCVVCHWERQRAHQSSASVVLPLTGDSVPACAGEYAAAEPRFATSPRHTRT